VWATNFHLWAKRSAGLSLSSNFPRLEQAVNRRAEHPTAVVQNGSEPDSREGYLLK